MVFTFEITQIIVALISKYCHNEEENKDNEQRQKLLLNIIIILCFKRPERTTELVRTGPTVSGKVGSETLSSIVPTHSNLCSRAPRRSKK